MTRLSEQQRLALRERFLAAWRNDRHVFPDEHYCKESDVGEVADKKLAWRIVLTLAETHPATFQRKKRMEERE